MNYYLAGTSVSLPINFVDDDGNPLEVTQGSYRIVDQNGVEIKPKAEFDVAQTKVTVEAEYNQIPALNPMEIKVEDMDSIEIDHLRILQFDLINRDGNTYAFDVSYLISPRERLIVGLNSFQTLNQAKLTALTMPETEVFLTEGEVRKVAALIEARQRICTLNIPSVNLRATTPSAYQKLSEQFKAALRKAQVAEANAILGGGDPIELALAQGLKSKTIGETHESYIGGRQLRLAVSKATLRYLSGFVSTSKVIARV
ncbi:MULTISPECIES: hypothetical protein [Acinetobacter calcoaceticus/baumannii complex]|uniref:Uncharacterized protein n=2 Tax=Acinetobacter baumannii TaxID=470 RepID=A0A1S2FHS7_ACIBA|nr:MULTISPECIES: hypothetical protein [Acinetobacter calcoaceticus/baumannii complex]EXB51348.1 hypothetical protein J540_1490 [Acinetobacter baumannii 1440422]ATI40445.1 hypothetical protein BS103_17945 [Acinetobacter baumannii]AUT40048.1 hypothetical protein C2U32_18970 [Acinetobacter baumannii]EHU3242110.1 hypothetical protein [Acinetobacter baumannii]EHZ7612084.1 hypothetical protein [Acinetobacter baumannii]